MNDKIVFYTDILIKTVQKFIGAYENDFEFEKKNAKKQCISIYVKVFPVFVIVKTANKPIHTSYNPLLSIHFSIFILACEKHRSALNLHILSRSARLRVFSFIFNFLCFSKIISCSVHETNVIEFNIKSINNFYFSFFVCCFKTTKQKNLLSWIGV